MSVPLAGPGAQDVALTCPGTGEHIQEAVTEDVASRRPPCTVPIARRLVPWASPGSSRSLGASPSGCTQSASGDRRTRRDNPGHLPGPSWGKPRRPAADRPDAALGRAFAVTLGLHRAIPGCPGQGVSAWWPPEQPGSQALPLLRSQAVVPEARTFLANVCGNHSPKL